MKNKLIMVYRNTQLEVSCKCVHSLGNLCVANGRNYSTWKEILRVRYFHGYSLPTKI